MVRFLAFLLRQILRKRLEEAEFTGSFTELLVGLARVRAVVLAGQNGERFLLRDESRP